MSVATLRRNRDCPHNEGVDEKVTQELAEVEAIALRIVRRNAANERDEKELRDRLPALRKAGVGPARLERAIHHVFVAGTISRWTAEAAGTKKPPRTPEPPEVSPDGT
jgi:hypothetical protein